MKTYIYANACMLMFIEALFIMFETQMPIKWLMDKQIVVQPYNGILLSH